MYFKDSCVTSLLPFCCREQSTALPTSIFPVYTGSGNSVLSIDASGLQMLNHGVQAAFGCMSGAGDMYLVSHGMTSDHIDPMNVLPYGYMGWELILGELDVNADTLTRLASNWERKTYTDEGKIITSMLLGLDAKFEIEVSMPLRKDCVIVKFRIKGYDYSNRPINNVKGGKMNFWLNMQTRKGNPVYHSAKLSGDTLSVAVDGHEHYEYSLRLTGPKDSKISFEKDRLSLTFDVSAGAGYEEYALLLDLDGRFGASDISALEKENSALRKAEFSELCRIRGLDIKEEFLFNNTIHLLISCFNMDKGLPIGMPFFFPWCWRSSTFWDSHFVMDGLMRCNAKEKADQFLKYLHKCMNNEGKPFSWMFAYDGTPTVENDRDIAPLVMCAHAMTAIKHFEYFNDYDILRGCGYDICYRVSSFAANYLFGKNENGSWILMAPVSGDVVDEAPREINQTFTSLWFLVIIKKTLEMQKLLGLEQNGLFLDITENYYLEHNNQEYLSSKGITAEDAEGASWVPFLLYPTEAVPFVDMALFCKTRDKYSFDALYMQKQGSYQPWTEFIQASSDFRRGAVEEGYKQRLLGLSHAFGCGYFSEIGPRQQTVGLPPYISAHGSFLTALLYQFVTVDIWENELNILSKMPNVYRGRDISIENVVCSGGLTVSASISKYEVNIHIRSVSVNTYKVFLPCPECSSRDLIRVYLNGDIADYDYDKSTDTISMTVITESNAEIIIR